MNLRHHFVNYGSYYLSGAAVWGFLFNFTYTTLAGGVGSNRFLASVVETMTLPLFSLAAIIGGMIVYFVNYYIAIGVTSLGFLAFLHSYFEVPAPFVEVFGFYEGYISLETMVFSEMAASLGAFTLVLSALHCAHAAFDLPVAILKRDLEIKRLKNGGPEDRMP